MSPSKLTRKIVLHFEKLKGKPNWLNKVHEDLKEIGLNKEETEDRTNYRTKIKEWEGFQDKTAPKRQGRKWTAEERKEKS